jgi:hypothetical protein
MCPCLKKIKFILNLDEQYRLMLYLPGKKLLIWGDANIFRGWTCILENSWCADISPSHGIKIMKTRTREKERKDNEKGRNGKDEGKI